MSKKWIDHEGNQVPAQYVPTLDKKKDRTAHKLAKKARWINEKLAEFKEKLFTECDGIWEEMLKAADVRTGEKGYTIHSFDKSIKVEVSQSQRIEFDDQIQLAKAKLFEWLDTKLDENDGDIRQVVHHAFETRKGKLDTDRVLSLFRLKIKDKLWNEAMDLVKGSVQRNISRRYARIYVKDQQGQYQLLDLNFSSVRV